MWKGPDFEGILKKTMKKGIIPDLLLIFTILSTILVSSCGASKRTMVIEEGWDLLGEQKVDFVRDRDEIDITSEEKYTGIAFYVQDRDVRLNEVTIYYQNGDKLEPSLDDVITADTYSRVIDIDREGRVLDKIQFRYRTTGNILKGRAKVLVIGKRWQS